MLLCFWKISSFLKNGKWICLKTLQRVLHTQHHRIQGRFFLLLFSCWRYKSFIKDLHCGLFIYFYVSWHFRNTCLWGKLGKRWISHMLNACCTHFTIWLTRWVDRDLLYCIWSFSMCHMLFTYVFFDWKCYEWNRLQMPPIVYVVIR